MVGYQKHSRNNCGSCTFARWSGLLIFQCTTPSILRSMPLIVALCAGPVLMSRQETHLTDDHTDTLKEEHFSPIFAHICPPNGFTWRPSVCINVFTAATTSCIHFVYTYRHGWKRNWYVYPRCPIKAHISRGTLLLHNNFLTSGEFQAREVIGCSSRQKPLAAVCACSIRTDAITKHKAQDQCQEERIQDVVCC